MKRTKPIEVRQRFVLSVGGCWRSRHPHYGLELCPCGPREWFDIPRELMAFDLVISTNPRDAYRLRLDGWGHVVADAENDENETVSFHWGVDEWIKDIMKKYPRRHLYVALEFEQ
jgi:hypothetical protein